MLTILQGDALTRLRELPDESVQCCVTSPPYWGLRDYGSCSCGSGRFDLGQGDGTGGNLNYRTAQQFKSDCEQCNGTGRIIGTEGQLGLEKTPEEYVARMVEIFREVRRVLRKDGTLWLNLGDSYAGSMKGEGGTYELSAKQNSNRGSHYGKDNGEKHSFDHGLKPKDLCGIPWRVAFALQADGWYLRQDIIWAKPNPMPESVTDRCTKAHEYMFLLTRSPRYFYDAEAIKERYAECTLNDSRVGNDISRGGIKDYEGAGVQNPSDVRARIFNNLGSGRNKRSVWMVATAPYPEAHFATYPSDLIKPCILAGTSAKGCCAKCGASWERVVERSGGTIGKGSWHNHENDLARGQRGGDNCNVAADAYSKGDYKVETLGWQPSCKCDVGVDLCAVLDPFAGSGTTGAVALELGRKAILIELNPKYVELIEQRCNVTMGLALA